MVSTVTTTTVTTVTLFGITALLGLAAVLMFISYLVAKEMLSASSSQRRQFQIQTHLPDSVVVIAAPFSGPPPVDQTPGRQSNVVDTVHGRCQY